MEKQSFNLIQGISKRCKTHTIIYNKEKESRATFFFKLKRRIVNIISKNPNIDLIHVNDGLMASLTTWITDQYNIPVVATFHGLDVVFPLKYFQNRIFPKFKKLSGCIAVSAATKNELISRGIQANRVFKIKNGIDHELAELSVNSNFEKELGSKIGTNLADKKILITMGRPVRRKGFSWFVKNVIPNLPEDVLLLIIGPYKRTNTPFNFLWKFVPKTLRSQLELFLGMSSDEDSLRHLLKNNRKVYHLGKLPFEEVIQCLSIADLFVMPNVKVDGDAEGFGLVALESTIRGTPVLAADLEGITEAIHHYKNGWLIKSEDKEEWVYTLYSLLSDQVKLRSFGESAKAYTIENFDWDSMVSGYYEVFNSLILEKKNAFSKNHGLTNLPTQSSATKSKIALW
jgi:phosphatidylinositol alpha-1,6-mannosyltransferase